MMLELDGDESVFLLRTLRNECDRDGMTQEEEELAYKIIKRIEDRIAERLNDSGIEINK